KVLVRLLLTESGTWRSQRGLTARNLKCDFDKLQKARITMLLTSMESERLTDALNAVRGLPPARYPDDQWNALKALFHVLRHALIELQLLFAEHGSCDFAELSIAARQALAATDDSDGSVDLALTPGGTLRHLLVDEMQDTSAAQYELIERLTHSWDGATQTLFLVGDPKQSIYLFRQARVERFLRTMREEKLGDISLQALHLTANFRSEPELVRGFNEIFEVVFPPDAGDGGGRSHVPYIRSTPARSAQEDAADKPIFWHVAIPSDLYPGEPKEIRALHEVHQAHEVCDVIARWQAKPLPAGRKLDAHGVPKPWSIAVLSRSRKSLGPIVTELKRLGIRYRAVDIDPLTTRQEVLDILTLTRALLHPADRVAWLAVLRAPWCGLSLADLLSLTGEGATAERWAPMLQLIGARREQLSEDGQRLLDRVWPVLTTAVSALGRGPFATHVERTWRSLGGDTFLSAEQRTNVLRFLSVLREVGAEESFVDLTVLEDRLKSFYAEPDAGATSLELLTIHKAKGLEWDVVLVPSLERGVPISQADLLDWLELDDTGDPGSSILLAPIEGKGADEADALCKWLRQARREREL
ncbi:MAG: UvrD-helicase domain-containing protein, partial [Bryocella sp.]